MQQGFMDTRYCGKCLAKTPHFVEGQKMSQSMLERYEGVVGDVVEFETGFTMCTRCGGQNTR